MRLYTGYHHRPERQPAGEPFIPFLRVEDLPEKVNWNEKGWLTPIKNQVSLFSCGQTRLLPFIPYTVAVNF